MNKNMLLTGGLLVIGLCLTLGVVMASQKTSLGQDELAGQDRRMNVSGTGVATSAPDILLATVGVESEGVSLSQVLAENSSKAQAVLDLLTDLGIENKDVQTINFSINETRDREGVRTGFRVSNNLRITIRDLESGGQVLDQVIAAGANRVSGIQFGLSDTSELLSQARARAVADAKAKAKELADAAGMFLGNPITISEGGGSQPFPTTRAAAFEADAGSVPLAAGELTVTVSVSITYEMY